jgi:transformation/transcription domain-associated protein
LTPDFLEPILAPVFNDILICLWKMLKAPPANQIHSHTAVRLLGKLGGKARKFSIPNPAFPINDYVGDGLILKFNFNNLPGKSLCVSGDPIVNIAIKIITSSETPLNDRLQAFHFLKKSMDAIFGLDIKPQTRKGLSECKSISNGLNMPTLEASRHLANQILFALFETQSQQDLREETSKFIVSIYNNIMTLYLSNEPMEIIDYDKFEEMIVEFFISSNESQSSFAWELILKIYSDYSKVVPDRERQFEEKIFFTLSEKIIICNN